MCRAAISISNLLEATFKFVFFKIVALKIKISPKNMKKLNFNKLSLKTLINRLHHLRLSEISRNIFRGNSWQLLLCMCMCLRPFTVKTSTVWSSWNVREQVKDVALNTFLSSAKSLYRYFRMKHQALLTSYFILFALEAGKATS